MDVTDITFWAGSEQSLAAYLASIKRMVEAGVTEPVKGSWYDRADPQQAQRAPRLFGRHGDVAVISVSGALNNAPAWVNEYTGNTSYEELRAALVHAAKDSETKTVLLDINSGGGAVSGVTDTADLISRIDSSVKPVHAFAGDLMASAALWLGTGARTLEIGKLAEIGSVGVLMVHQDLSKMYAEMGITNTVLRSGRFKALGHSSEPLSDTAREQFQAQLDQMAAMFTQHVADARGVSYAVADSRMGQGRVFVGQSGVDVGLADSVTNFDAVIGRLQAGEIDLRHKTSQSGANLRKGSLVKNSLTEQEVAALALGGISAAETPPVAAETPPVAETLAPPAEANAVVEMLQSQLATATDKLVALTVEKQTLATANSTLQASASQMRSVVQKVVGTLRINLGGSAAGVETLKDDSLTAEYASLSDLLYKKFASGGVAVSSAATGKENQETHDPMRLARIASTRPQTK